MTTIRVATADDAAAIAAIYQGFVAHTAITFETDPVSPSEMAERIRAGEDLYPWFVAEEGAELLGYAYASRFRPRNAYRFAVETTVYLHPQSVRRGIGSALYESVLATARAQGFTQAIAAISLPNRPSVALHEKLGFRQVGTYHRVGYKLGEWYDVGLWQCELGPPPAAPAEPRRLSELGLPRVVSAKRNRP